MQSNKINVLMISYGRGALYENKAGVLDRHVEYSSHFNSLKIIYLTKKKLKKKNLGNLIIVPVFGNSYLVCFLKALFINLKNYHVVTTQDPFLTGLLGLFYKKRFKLKLHVQNHSNFIDNKYWIKENKFNLILNQIAKKIILPQANRLRVVNSFEKANYIKKLNIPEKIIDVAPISVNPIFHSKVTKQLMDDFNDIHKIENKKFKIGWAGRFVRLKRLDILFEYASLLDDENEIQLILAGNNLNTDFDLEALERIHSIKPVYTGQLAPIELVKFYKSLDVFVLTSEYEGYGMVLAEALTCNTPVLVSDSSNGTFDIIKENNHASYFSSFEDFKTKIFELKNNKTRNFNSNLNFKTRTSVESIIKTIFV
jgi:glycosyltransferase involved in cell wall biosynthesis